MINLRLLAALLLLSPAALAADGLPWYAPALDPLLTAVGLGLAGLVSWLSAEAIRWLRLRVSQEQTQEALVLLTEATTAAVAEVMQVYVDAIKEGATDGKLTAEEAAEAKRRAVERARDLLGTSGLATIERVLNGALQQWLSTKVEEAVRGAK